jgi:hypothetical protein
MALSTTPTEQWSGSVLIVCYSGLAGQPTQLVEMMDDQRTALDDVQDAWGAGESK